MQKVEDGLKIDDSFLDEQVLDTSQELILWFANYANYIASDLVLEDLSFQQRKRFMHEVRKFFWDEPYLFRICADRVIHRCTPKVEIVSLLS